MKLPPCVDMQMTIEIADIMWICFFLNARLFIFNANISKKFLSQSINSLNLHEYA